MVKSPSSDQVLIPLIVVMAPRSVQPIRSDIINSGGLRSPYLGKVAEWLIASVLKTDVLVAPWVQIPPFPLESNSTHKPFEITIMTKLTELENILCDVDGLIGAALEAGDTENARALVEEFGEWFMDYEDGVDIHMFCVAEGNV